MTNKKRITFFSKRALNLTGIWIGTLIFVLALATAAHAADDGKAADKAPAPEEQETASATTEIRADQVDMDLKEGKAIFEGNVFVSDGKMMLESASMTVYFTENNKLTRIEASGNVVITQPEGGRRATAGRAAYDIASGEVVLTENPTLRIGDHALQNAEQIVYNRDSQKVSTKGKSGEPVRMQFAPGKEGGNFELFEGTDADNGR